MEILLVTRPDYFEGESKLINQLFDSGLKVLHIRKPASDRRSLRKLIQEIDPSFYHRIAIHQHHELAEEFSLSRLHYPEHLRKLTIPDGLMKLQGNGIKLSTSIHDFSVLPGIGAFDYVFYGPVFTSISKPGYESIIPPTFSLPSRSKKPAIIAIGGITADLLKKAEQMNFDGAAVLGAVWQHPAQSVEVFKALINQ